MTNNNDAKSKASSFDAIMGNKAFADIIFDSWNAPVGSLKYKKAKMILQNINKGNQGSNDGQGGPGPTNGLTSNPFSQFQSSSSGQSSAQGMYGNSSYYDPSKKTTFIKSVDHMVQNATPSKFSQDAEKALANISPALSELWRDTKTTAANLGKLAVNAVTAYPRAGVSVGNYFRDSENQITPLPKLGYSSYGLSDAEIKSIYSKYGFPTPDVSWVRKNVGTTDAQSLENTLTAQRAKMGLPAIKTNSSNSQGFIGPMENPNKTNSPVNYDNEAPIGPLNKQSVDQQRYDLASDIKDNYGSTGLDAWYGSLQGSDKQYYQSAYEAVKAGVGAETFSMQAMGNPKMLEGMGLPASVVNMFSNSPLLSDQLIDLRNGLKKEYQIDAQLNRLNELTARGMTITDDLQAYIRGKDQYMGEIDKMMDKTKTQMAYMDTSNPAVAKTMNSYVNYLTILKGRQNQRYIDFLDSGINYHNAEVANLTNLYKTNLEAFQETYKDAATITAETYTNLKTMLKEMYTNIEARTAAAEEAKDKEMQRTLTALQMQSIVAENAKFKAEFGIQQDPNTGEIISTNPGGLSGSPISKVSSADLAAMDEIMGIKIDKDGNILSVPGYDVLEAAMKAQQSGHNTDVAVQRYAEQAAAYIKSKASSGSFIDESDKFTSTRQQYNQTPEAEEYFKNMQSQVEPSLAQGIKSYLESSEERITALRAAINDLTGVGWFTSQKKPNEKTKKKFISDYSGSLGDVANGLYDIFETSVSQYGVPAKDVFNDANGNYLPDQDQSKFISEISRNISDRLLYR